MLPREARSLRQPRPSRRQPIQHAVESLESRALMNYSPLGTSYPDLVVQGQAPPVAAYGAPITVSMELANIGSNTVIEPANEALGNPGTAAAPASAVGVYISRNPRRLTGSALKLGDLAAPPIIGGGVAELTGTFTMPVRPRGYPADGSNLYVYFVANEGGAARELNRRNDISRADQPVQLAPALPDIYATAINVPASIQAGDVVRPEIKIANYGTVATNLQGPLTVQLVASSDTNYGPGDVVLASATIKNIPPLSAVPATQTVLGNSTLDEPVNVLTVTFPAVSLPANPQSYYLGVAVDPYNTIHEIHEINSGPSAALQEVVNVGPNIPHLPPAGRLTTPANRLLVFPIPPYGVLTAPYLPAFEPPGPIVSPTTTTTTPITSGTTTTPVTSTTTTTTGSTSGTNGYTFSTQAYVVSTAPVLAPPSSGQVNQAPSRSARLSALRAHRRP